jgi:hypothetical protein
VGKFTGTREAADIGECPDHEFRQKVQEFLKRPVGMSDRKDLNALSVQIHSRNGLFHITHPVGANTF